MVENAKDRTRPIMLEDCTTVEAAEHLAEHARAIIPVGSTEQHGPHLPYGTDSWLATEVSRRVAEQLGGVVFPPVTYAVAGEHRGYPATCYVGVRTFHSLIQDVAWCAADSGFRNIVFINGHYTNTIVLNAAIMEIGHKLPRGARAYSLNYWDGVSEEQRERYIGIDVGLHANIGETSAVLAIAEDKVHMDRAVAEYPNFSSPVLPAQVPGYFFSGYGATRAAFESGVWGDPTGSTRELGEEFLDWMVEGTAALIPQVETLMDQRPLSNVQAPTREADA